MAGRTTAACTLAAALLCAWVTPAGAGEVDAGDLRARFAADPWHLELTDRAGRPVLDEARGTGAGPTGTLGFRTSSGWSHATRVVSEGSDGTARTAELATTDPTRRLAVRIAPDAEGVIAIQARVVGPLTGDVTATGIAFAGAPGERYLGFGERSNAVDQRGNTLESYVAEGPYQAAERPFIAAAVPPPGFRPRDDATYFPIPWLLSTRGYGVLVDNDETSYHRLGSDVATAWSLEVEATELRFRIFAGPRPADVLARFSARLGRQPPAGAPFFFGPWYQPKGDPYAQLDLLRTSDVPLSVAQTYTHYLPCGDHRAGPAGERDRIRRFHEAGLAITTYFNPMICTTYGKAYDEAKAAGALTKDQNGQTYEYRYTGSEPFFVGQYDFTAPAGRDMYARLIDEALADGHDGWMEDFGEYTPLDARSSDGQTGSAGHNRYVVDYHCGAFAAANRAGRPIARFNRSGWTGAARCSQIVWNGDPTVGWGFDGLESAIRNGLTMGLSGVSTWGSDIGGFFALGNNPGLSPELLIRWLQFGAVSGVMRTQANGFHLPASPRAQISDRDVIGHWRRYAKLRTQLYPYIAAADREYQRSGLPIMRHLALVHPEDADASAREDEFMFGPDLLAAPVFHPGERERSLYVPAGRWFDFERTVAYEPRTGGRRMGALEPVAPGMRRIAAPLDRMPLLVRAGAVLPLLAADVDSLADYGRDPNVVRLRDRLDRLELLAFPRGRSSAEIGEGEQILSAEGRRRWTLRVSGKRRRAYRLQANLGALERPFRPCRVTLAGRALPRRRWHYDRRAKVLRATFRTRSGRLVATRSCRARRTSRR